MRVARCTQEHHTHHRPTCLPKFKRWCANCCIVISDLFVIVSIIRMTSRRKLPRIRMAANPCAVFPPAMHNICCCLSLSFGRRYVGGGSGGGGLSATVIDESLLADKLKAQGAKSVEDFERDLAAKQKPKPFQGAGSNIRGESVQAEPTAPSSAPEKRHILSLWKNGIRSHSFCSSLSSLRACSLLFSRFMQPQRRPSRPAHRPQL